MVTIFGNIRISDEDSLEHLKDCCFSLRGISDNWVINVRGTLRESAVAFLREEIGDHLRLFELLNDSRGWIPNAREMLTAVKYDHLFILNEDHINIAGIEVLKGALEEMQKHDADVMTYSWWMDGKLREGIDLLEPTRGTYVDTVYMTKDKWATLRARGYPYYLISLCGVLKKDFFIRLLALDEHKLPLFLTRWLYKSINLLRRHGFSIDKSYVYDSLNKLLFYRLRRFTKEAPFDLEKGQRRTDILPVKISYPKQELLAGIDDDLKVIGVDGYQLIKRGGYPLRNTFYIESANMYIDDRVLVKGLEDIDVLSKTLPKDTCYAMVYYEDVVRLTCPLTETTLVKIGKVRFTQRDSVIDLEGGQAITYYTNIPYRLEALEDTDIDIIKRTRGKKIAHKSSLI
ncbi:MAG: hypothetical protein Q8P93_04940 [bacterium]|nr:hypothetical protein [bacterium]